GQEQVLDRPDSQENHPAIPANASECAMATAGSPPTATRRERPASADTKRPHPDRLTAEPPCCSLSPMGTTWKHAVVVGASSGIGEALAKRLAASGCKVGLVARREAELARICDETNAGGACRAHAYPHD